MVLSPPHKCHESWVGGASVELPILKLMIKRLVVTGSTLRPRSADEKARVTAEVERVVWPWVVSGKVKAIIDRSLQAVNKGKFVIDQKDSSEDSADEWLHSAATFLPQDRVVLDTSTKVLTGLTDVTARTASVT